MMYIIFISTFSLVYNPFAFMSLEEALQTFTGSWSCQLSAAAQNRNPREGFSRGGVTQRPLALSDVLGKVIVSKGMFSWL